MTQGIAVLFGALGLFLHSRLAPQSDGVWLPTENEVNGVAEPLARIANRHAPISDAIAGDAADGIEAAIVLGGYGMHSLIEQRAYTEAVAGAETAAQQHQQDAHGGT